MGKEFIETGSLLPRAWFLVDSQEGATKTARNPGQTCATLIAPAWKTTSWSRMMDPSDSQLRFVIVRDYKENRRKCTLSPLKGNEHFEFIELGHPSTWKETVEIPGGILLSVDAPELTCEDRDLLDAGAIVIVDCTWARVETVLQRVGVESGEAIARRSLPKDVVTAYPRTSKLFDDPGRGLASIEAVFTATVALGHPSPDFLLHYRWASEFLTQNDLTWRRLGWDPQSSHHGADGE